MANAGNLKTVFAGDGVADIWTMQGPGHVGNWVPTCKDMPSDVKILLSSPYFAIFLVVEKHSGKCAFQVPTSEELTATHEFHSPLEQRVIFAERGRTSACVTIRFFVAEAGTLFAHWFTKFFNTNARGHWLPNSPPYAYRPTSPQLDPSLRSPFSPRYDGFDGPFFDAKPHTEFGFPQEGVRTPQQSGAPYQGFRDPFEVTKRRTTDHGMLPNFSMQQPQQPIKHPISQATPTPPPVEPSDSIDPFFGTDLKDRVVEASSLEATLDLLSQAVENGHTEKACEIVKELSSKRAKITMEPVLTQEEEEDAGLIDLFVNIEDKVSSGGRCRLRVDPKTTTIETLKAKVNRRLHFPPEVQRWIIGKRLPRDDELLGSLGINSSGFHVHLYISSAKQAGIRKCETDDGFRIEKIPSTASGENRAVFEKGATNVQDERALPPPVEVVEATDEASNGKDPVPRLPSLPSSTASEAVNPSTNQAVIQEYPEAPIMYGWVCTACTFRNVPTRPGCEVCGTHRPDDYQVPTDCYIPPEEKERMLQEKLFDVLAKEAEEKRTKDQKKRAMKNFYELMTLANGKIVRNTEAFECVICYVQVDPGEGIVLRECLHSFCRDCLKMTILAAEDPEVKCPFRDDNYDCQAEITGQEIMALLDPNEFSQHLSKSLTAAERKEKNSYHCQTANCHGWCIYEDDVNWFDCEVCGHRNCLTCKAIHEGKNCKMYQDDLRIEAENDVSAKKTREMIKKLIAKGDAMECPHCSVVLQKKEGCDWMRCSMCRTEVCWATKGPRWGPKGSGDITGGCKCRIDGKRCSPKCKNCH